MTLFDDPRGIARGFVVSAIGFNPPTRGTGCATSRHFLTSNILPGILQRSESRIGSIASPKLA
ncbi:hypothetical protein [Ruegeria sp. HKCCA0370]|uniref:hypothetical protein n=1 Tax=Ruegeria sp. HKCCA0370 TaxID=2682995 RepID=UPI00148A0B4B|nr:hypothetical protein [Ruegeria sp. HKCCA0370]